jgi:Leucine-rich repeat (LRR) protein
MKRLNHLLKSIFSLLIVGLVLSACSSTPEVKINSAWWNSLDENWQAYFMKTLEIKENPTQDDFDKIKQLEVIDMMGQTQEFTTLEPLSDLKNLKKLWLGGLQIDSLNYISTLTGLEELNVGQSNIRDISPLSSLKNLKKLELFETNIDDISALAGLTKLEFLDCSKTKIKDLSPISELENLKVLYLNNTPLKSLKGLGNLTNIEELSFIQAKVDDLTPLEEMKGLRELVILDTNVSSLDPISGIESLSLIYCEGAPISNEQISKFLKNNAKCEIL